MLQVKNHFIHSWKAWKKKWNTLEQTDSKLQPKFFTWFQKYESYVFATAMIKPKCETAGLGSPAAQTRVKAVILR